MRVVELLGAIGENQDYVLYSKDNKRIEVETAALADAKVLGIIAEEKNLIRIETNIYSV